MDRCPVCNARLIGVNICPRCQADLNHIIANAQQAQYWLQQSLQFWILQEIPIAMMTLAKSLRCKQTPVALALRNIMCQRQYSQVFRLLAQHKVFEAKQLLKQLEILDSSKFFKVFCEYLQGC